MMLNYNKCREEDYEFIYNLKKEVYYDYIIKYYGEYNEQDQRERFNYRINEIKDDTYIINYRKVCIGFYTLRDYENYIELENICIMKQFQGLGLGTKVLKDIIKSADKEIKLQYFKDNPVYKLYEKLGFIVDGENDNHYTMSRKR